LALLACGALCAGVQDTTVGARARAMGGGSSAFEDDPLSVWCNPAGLATQQSGAALELQTYAVYRQNDVSVPPTHFSGAIGFNDPGPLPSYLGGVYQVGTVERPQAVGICFVSPVLLRMAYDAPDDFDGLGNLVSPNTWKTVQRLSRLRLAYARDFKFRPAGEEGWFPHLSIGLGMDVGFSSLRMEDPVIDQDRHGSKSEFGAGFGFLLGAYDNTRNLKINIGGAYQTSISFDLAIPVTQAVRNAPALNWPNQVQLGALVYLLEGLPLRLSAEVQFVDWQNAGAPSDIPGVGRFSRTTITSFGGEYRISWSPTTLILPRLGIKLYDAPWTTRDKARLPAFEEWQLRITTRAERFTVFCLGFGISFLGEGGGATSLNVSVEFGADAPVAALGAVFVF
jgi:hypothetical protein